MMGVPGSESPDWTLTDVPPPEKQRDPDEIPMKPLGVSTLSHPLISYETEDLTDIKTMRHSMPLLKSCTVSRYIHKHQERMKSNLSMAARISSWVVS